MRPSVAHTLSDGRSSIDRASFVSDDVIGGSGTFGTWMHLNFNFQGLENLTHGV